MTLYEQVAYVERRQLPGAFVECGVWRGGGAAMMALANLAEAAERRVIHLFDSFEGMPAPSQELDGPEAARLMAEAAQRGVACNAAAPEEALRLIVERAGYPEAFVRVHQGWFQDTLPADRDGIGPIALLRIDGDWYDSTRVVFEQLYDRVAPGGVIVIDDYGHFEGCRRATDEFLARHAPHAYLHHIDYTGRYLIKPEVLA
ncbi:MAG: macrocin O-methyltransferase [Dehalococcoidia bacterium]|nr:MAG: macrocin O-methyltransferase [Dehalococcoidia bacterium]